MHSVTKMIGGHSDLTLGALVGDRQRIEASQDRWPRPSARPAIRSRAGWRCAASRRSASGWRRACSTALDLARRFEDHPGVARVYYPLPPFAPRLPRWPTACSRAGGGTIVTIDLGSRDRAESFIRALAGSIPFAPSLGDVQTTLSHPATTSHRGQDAAAMARQGINAGMVRVSVGVEDPEDLWREFHAALDRHRDAAVILRPGCYRGTDERGTSS